MRTDQFSIDQFGINNDREMCLELLGAGYLEGLEWDVFECCWGVTCVDCIVHV